MYAASRSYAAGRDRERISARERRVDYPLETLMSATSISTAVDAVNSGLDVFCGTIQHNQ
jgi:hypothetical protein